MATQKTGAARQAAFRESGKQVSVVLRDPAAIRALEELAVQHGGIKAAISFALTKAIKRAPAKKA